MKRILLLLSFFALFFNLNAQEKITTEQYIKKYSRWAVEEMERVGIPASITLGQGILESGSGNSRLAQEGKNHFGIKCHSDWDGERIYEDDDAENECFRKYKSVYESFKDHSEFLLKYSRYDFLFDLDPEDYKAWAKGLKKAGYATNPKYADILIGLIERHELYEFDNTHASDHNLNLTGNVREEIQPGFSDDWVIDPYDRDIRTNNDRPYIIARGGDNVISLAQEFEMMPWQFYKYNDMRPEDEIKKGQIVYLKPKRNKAASGNETHVVQDGESLWDISQLYAVKIKSLKRKNNISDAQSINQGDTIYLRSSKDGGFLGIF